MWNDHRDGLSPCVKVQHDHFAVTMRCVLWPPQPKLIEAQKQLLAKEMTWSAVTQPWKTRVAVHCPDHAR